MRTSIGVDQPMRWVCGWLEFERRQGQGIFLLPHLYHLWVKSVDAGGYFPWQTTMESVEVLPMGLLCIFIGKFYWYKT
jgi:hypothetical protein